MRFFQLPESEQGRIKEVSIKGLWSIYDNKIKKSKNGFKNVSNYVENLWISATVAFVAFYVMK